MGMTSTTSIGCAVLFMVPFVGVGLGLIAHGAHGIAKGSPL